jgi:RNA polymerase sigma-70 factor (ECF subfamily)
VPTRTPTEPADDSRAPVARPNPRVELPVDTRTRFRDGDVDALGEVYDRYSRAVWSVAIGVVKADHLAQEAVQEAFLRAWNAAATYDPDRDLGPWLLAIARFTALDLLRRELRPTRGGHEEMPEAAEATGVDPPGIDAVWVAWAVQEALRQLADHEREIVRLSFYEDLTHAQIAERLDLPIGTVKSRSHRAHRRLADLLAHLRDEPAGTDGGNRPATGPRTPDKAPATGEGSRR